MWLQKISQELSRPLQNITLGEALIIASAGLVIMALLRLVIQLIQRKHDIAKPIRAVNALLHRIMLWTADIALIAMVIIVSLAVTLRYVFNTGIGWAEEVPRLLVTLFAFLALAMGVRDHVHIGVNIVYNLFAKDGRVRRFMEFFADYIVLLCGLFMLLYGFVRCEQMSRLPGQLPMTGLNTWWQYLPIPLAGFFVFSDSFLFLTGLVKRDDILYSEPEVDYVEEYEESQKQLRAEKEVTSR